MLCFVCGRMYGFLWIPFLHKIPLEPFFCKNILIRKILFYVTEGSCFCCIVGLGLKCDTFGFLVCK